jgi:glycosyltransferase involved in cell wall biosynthesis
MRVALVQSAGLTPLRGSPHGALPNPRSLNIARALRDQGHAVTFIVPQTGLQPAQPLSAPVWQVEGFPWIPIGAAHLPPALERFPRDPWLITARAMSSLLLSFDAVWLFEPEWAMPALRERRFSEQQLPIFMLDGPAAPEPIPSSLDEINRAFARRYALQWADFVCEETDDPATTILQVETLCKQRSDLPPRHIPSPTTSPAVTVCIPCYEAPAFLPETLLSLERQTTEDFTVVVVDDGSPSSEARAAFDACAARYADRDWTFLRQPNLGPGAARNRAAQHAATEFLLFLDADDIAMPNMVERFLRAALLTGDDCLVAPNYGFHDNPDGPCALLYDPPGNNLIASMGDDMHGGSCIFIRREAFDRLGGFTELRGIGFEDYEFHVRANLSGLRWDVLPEFVYRYRMPQAGNVSTSTAAYPNLARVLRWYEDRLRPPGLGQLPLAFASAYWGLERENEQVKQLTRTLDTRRAKRSPQDRELKLLLLTCNFPFGLVSGWHTRVQQMIRYLGQRYQLTLMTAMPREQLAPLRRQVFQHLHAVLGVEGSNISAITAPNTPFRVREHYTDVFQAAIRALPTDHFHAAILDQIFMAEFRHDIDTLPVLTEHNIESRLLHQAAELTGDDLWSASLPLHYRNARTEAALLERYEDHAWPDFPLRAVVSELDRAELDRRAPNGNTVVSPNGADLSTWLPNARFEQATVLFAGHLAYLPNVDAVQFLLAEIWPKVRQRKPNARLIIAGRDPSAVVQAAVAQAGAGIELCASPPSMDRLAARASITVAPLRLGSGTRVKVLDSLAWGLPTVGTTLGVEGIDVIDGEHLLICDDPSAFAEAIVQLLSDEALWRRLRNTSGALVRERYSWDCVFKPLEDALIELIP